MLIKTTVIDDKGNNISDSIRKFKIWDNEKGYLFRSKNFFVKQFEGFKLSEFITNKTDYANMHLLAEKVYKDTNMIAVHTRGKSSPADLCDIAYMLKLRERTAREFINRMMVKGLIAKVTVNVEEQTEVQYYLSPLFFMSNKYLSPFLYMLFRKQLDPYLQPWAISALNEAGNLIDKTAIVQETLSETANVRNELKDKVVRFTTGKIN